VDRRVQAQHLPRKPRRTRPKASRAPQSTRDAVANTRHAQATRCLPCNKATLVRARWVPTGASWRASHDEATRISREVPRGTGNRAINRGDLSRTRATSLPTHASVERTRARGEVQQAKARDDEASGLRLAWIRRVTAGIVAFCPGARDSR